MVLKNDCYKDAHLVLKELKAIKLDRQLLPSEQMQYCKLLSLLQIEIRAVRISLG